MTAVHSPRSVAAVGDSNDPNTWSGIPFNFLRAGVAQGLLDEGLDLDVGGLGWRVRRWIWNATRPVVGRGLRGYQYSEGFLEGLWDRWKTPGSLAVVVNCFQLYPPSIIADQDVEKWYFIDQTLTQVFDYYEEAGRLGRDTVADALALEQAGYRSAEGIVTHSHWAGRNVIETSGVDPARVHVVQPGPSLDPAAIAAWEPRDRHRHLQLVFVGKDWYRKGLDRLLEGLVRARDAGFDVRLRVIGCAQRSVPKHLRGAPGVEWLGFIPKANNDARFIALVGDADVGCLLSRFEAGGIALREYHSLGLPVIGPATGGAPEHMVPDASIAIDPDAPVDEIGEVLISLAGDDGRLEGLTREARGARSTVSWEASMGAFSEFWPHVRNGRQ